MTKLSPQSIKSHKICIRIRSAY